MLELGQSKRKKKYDRLYNRKETNMANHGESKTQKSDKGSILANQKKTYMLS